MKKNKHVIVISYDAFSKDNWESAKKKPHLAKLIAKGASTTQVRSVYPTLTYVIHSSYVTGAYPNKHGVFHNNPFQPFVPVDDQDWHWYRDVIKLPTIYEAATAKGLKTASNLWPVTGKAKIDYNIPEMKAVRGENQALKVLKNGSKLYSAMMELKFGKLRDGIKQPHLDDFTTACTVETIKKKKPHLLLTHLIDLDEHKHHHGTKAEIIEDVIERMDNRIGQIVHATYEAGIADETTFIIIGDHGQLDVHYKVYLNRLFKDNGLIYKENGEMHWRAYVQSADGSAYLHVKENDTEAKDFALKLLEEAANQPKYGIEAIYSRSKLEQFHVEDKFEYMLEAKAGYAFANEHDKEVIVDLHENGERHATHGYSPYKNGYTSNLIITGPGVKTNYQLKEANVVDLAPTIAHILELDFKAVDGRALTEVFED